MLLKLLFTFGKAQAPLKTQSALENKSWAPKVAFTKILCLTGMAGEVSGT